MVSFIGIAETIRLDLCSIPGLLLTFSPVSRQKLVNTYGVITFILSHPDAVQAYLREQEHRFEVLQAKHPLPSEMEERYNQLKPDKV
jgi:hypothetical protein